ncbi:T9SS type A sorting domain-containing protein [bacterium SCSIO 12741]|nr:T9SS type A sorting domain-containing protein [bacterium SCSIO 12741]
MKLSYLLRGAVFSIGSIVAVSLFMSYSNSPAPKGYTGSPADGRTCGTNGGCHGGGATQMPGMIITDIPAEGYTPGQTYNVSVMVRDSGRMVFGFSLTAQNNAGDGLGTLIPGAGTELSNDNIYISHKTGTTRSGNSKTWPFQWKAPAAGTGTVSFYATGNAGNDNRMASGDNVYMDALTVEEKSGGGTTGIQVNANHEDAFSIFPNPAQDFMRVHSKNAGLLTVYNLNGELMLEQQLNHDLETVDVSTLERGLYVVNFDNGVDALLQQTLIKY